MSLNPTPRTAPDPTRRLPARGHRRMRHPLLPVLALLAALPAAAALDPDASIDDHSVNQPTGWWTFTNLSPTQLAKEVRTRQARVAELEVHGVASNGEPRFTARLLPNQGAYAIAGANWTWDKTAAELQTFLAAQNGRPIEIERYDRGGGNFRYAAVYVPDSGATARQWSWVLNATASQVQAQVDQGMRPIDLDGRGNAGARRYDAVFVANTGADHKSFDWAPDLSRAQLDARLASWGGRPVKIERFGDGRYALVQVANGGSDASAWWRVHGFASLADVNRYAMQTGSRPIDLLRYSSGASPRYDALMIDNANAETRRIRGLFSAFFDAAGNPVGRFSSYFKRVDGEVLIDLNGAGTGETASTLKVLHLLHALRQVHAGDALGSAFRYYDYGPSPTGQPKDACPDPAYEHPGWARETTLETGLDWMMSNSDNRTTRGVVLRYGGSYDPLNATAAAAGMVSTVLRHDIGCTYWDFAQEILDPAGKRNDTSAADLARLYENVHAGRVLPKGSLAYGRFFQLANPSVGSGTLYTIVEQEAQALGKGAIVPQFVDQMRRWGKTGSYGACLPAASDPAECGQAIIVRGSAGLVALPIRGGPYISHRYYAYGSMISDIPVESGIGGPDVDRYQDAYDEVKKEMFRAAIRSALQTW